MQSASLPGRAGPWVIFLRMTCLAAFRRALARSMASCAMRSPSSTCWLSHRLKASWMTPSTMPAAWRDDSRSLVWPANCGSCSLPESTKERRSHTSSGASFTPRGNRLRMSQNSRDRIGEAGTQAVHVSAALGGGNQVDVTFLHQLAFRAATQAQRPTHRPRAARGVRTVRPELLRLLPVRRAGNRAGRPRSTTRSLHRWLRR